VEEKKSGNISRDRGEPKRSHQQKRVASNKRPFVRDLYRFMSRRKRVPGEGAVVGDAPNQHESE